MSESRTDAENQDILRRLQPEYERLRTERIRSQGEVDRAEKDLQAALDEAKELYGTSDVAELRRMVEETRARNTKSVDEFTDAVRKVSKDLEELASARR